MFARGPPSNMTPQRHWRNVMCIEKFARNMGFALAALAIVAGLAATIEFEPMVGLVAPV